MIQLKVWFAWLAIAGALLVGLVAGAAQARAAGHEDSPFHSWFKTLRSPKGGLCCDFVDGRSVDDPDWGKGADGHYWVIVDGQRYEVPDDSLVTVPNKFGRAVVWPGYIDGKPGIRCFMPGPEA